MELSLVANWSAEVVAEVLNISSRALQRWEERRRAGKLPCRRGRPEVINPEARQAIRECYKQHFCQWGPRVLADWCRRTGVGDWSHGAIAQVVEDLRPEPEPDLVPVRYEATASNVLWSEDGTEFKQDGKKQELLVVQDDHARLKLNTRLAKGPACGQDVAASLREAFDKYGAPLVLKQDLGGMNHTSEVKGLLNEYGVLSLTSPLNTPRYNGKIERCMRDIKSYERAMGKAGAGGSLEDRIYATIKDLNEDRPRPVLEGRTAQEAYNEGQTDLPDRREFREEVNRRKTKILADASSRVEIRTACRWAIEQTLISYGLVKIEDEVSHDFL